MCRWNYWEARAGHADCCCRQSRPAGHHRSSVMHLLSSFKVNCLLLCAVSDTMTLPTRVKAQHLHTPTPAWGVRPWAVQVGCEEHSAVEHSMHSLRTTAWP